MGNGWLCVNDDFRCSLCIKIIQVGKKICEEILTKIFFHDTIE